MDASQEQIGQELSTQVHKTALTLTYFSACLIPVFVIYGALRGAAYMDYAQGAGAIAGGFGGFVGGFFQFTLCNLFSRLARRATHYMDQRSPAGL